jgi:hypothetical protein
MVLKRPGLVLKGYGFQPRRKLAKITPALAVKGFRAPSRPRSHPGLARSWEAHDFQSCQFERVIGLAFTP